MSGGHSNVTYCVPCHNCGLSNVHQTASVNPALTHTCQIVQQVVYDIIGSPCTDIHRTPLNENSQLLPVYTDIPIKELSNKTLQSRLTCTSIRSHNTHSTCRCTSVSIYVYGYVLKHIFTWILYAGVNCTTINL